MLPPREQHEKIFNKQYDAIFPQPIPLSLISIKNAHIYSIFEVKNNTKE